MFIDEAEIVLKGGHGGPGKSSFFKQGRGPDGGNGGKGGDLYIKTTSDLSALSHYSHIRQVSATDGEGGESNRKAGRNGQDKTIALPVGKALTLQWRSAVVRQIGKSIFGLPFYRFQLVDHD